MRNEYDFDYKQNIIDEINNVRIENILRYYNNNIIKQNQHIILRIN